jgi:hypothetical protein
LRVNSALTSLKLDGSELPIKQLRADTLTKLNLREEGLGPTEGIVLAKLVEVSSALTEVSLYPRLPRCLLSLTILCPQVDLRYNGMGGEVEATLREIAESRPSLTLGTLRLR